MLFTQTIAEYLIAIRYQLSGIGYQLAVELWEGLQFETLILLISQVIEEVHSSAYSINYFPLIS